MNFYADLGYLVLGSRLRRLSESFLTEVNRTYHAAGIDFDASWFPVFYLLSQNASLSIKELSELTEVSHSAASQLVASLKNKKLLKTTTSGADGRRHMVELTKSGRILLEQIMPVWDAVTDTMKELVDNDPHCESLLTVIGALEHNFRAAKLSEKISSRLATA